MHWGYNVKILCLGVAVRILLQVNRTQAGCSFGFFSVLWEMLLFENRFCFLKLVNHDTDVEPTLCGGVCWVRSRLSAGPSCGFLRSLFPFSPRNKMLFCNLWWLVFDIAIYPVAIEGYSPLLSQLHSTLMYPSLINPSPYWWTFSLWTVFAGIAVLSK